MPWQQYVADVVLEVDPVTGLLVYREYDILVPRQSGKTTFMLSKFIHRAHGFGGPQRSIYTAQTRNDARQKFEDDQIPDIQRSPFDRLVKKYRMTNGNEAILWKNGSIHGISSTTEKAAHGKTLDEGMIDEAFAHVDARVEQAMRPAMVTRQQAQLGVVSTAGTAASLYLKAKVDRGRERAHLQRSFAYFEWSAPDDAKWNDPATWLACMPALGHTVTLDTILAECDSMDEAEFRRAYLNQWVDRTAKDVVIPNWPELQVDRQPGDGDVVFAIDTSHGRGMSSIVSCESRGERVQVELVEYLPGTEWVVQRADELNRKWRPARWVVDAKGPAASLLPALESLDGFPLVVSNYQQMVAACGLIYDLAAERRLAHVGQPQLSEAVAAAAKRELGDAYAWTRKGSGVDISPFVAATLAVWGHSTQERAGAPSVFFI